LLVIPNDLKVYTNFQRIS